MLATVTVLGDLWSHQKMLSPMLVSPFYDKVVLAVVGNTANHPPSLLFHHHKLQH